MGTEENSGKAAVITGASSGIGAATARTLHAAGFSVALLARRKDRLDALAAELGPGTLALEADVTRRDDLLLAAQRVETELGGADVLVNNAGVMLLGPFGPEHDAEYQTMVNVNLLGAITATEVFLDQLRERSGDLVNISSVAGRTSRPGDAVYAATKWGLIGFSDCLRKELLPDVRVTVIEPGAVATELPGHITDPETRAQTEASYAEVSITAEDVAAVVAFAVAQPPGVGLNEVTVRPRKQLH
ncbi:SDR family oxidoreductase [Arthrobacter luteolus]|uniref:SDR family oxidoreductase n=1 Tax=Arthrobacter luteolus TaxID=98672 RepID=UPI0038500940